ILSWAGTAAFLPVFAAILLVFDPAQRIARLFGQRPQEYVAGTLQVALVAAFRLCGVRLAVEHAPGFVPGRSYVVISNHQSMFDTAPDVPVVPITIDQSWRLLAHNMFPIPWGVRVRVRIGEPIARRPDDATALVERVREEMLATLARWRGSAAPGRPA